jgi:hypothetical protein
MVKRRHLALRGLLLVTACSFFSSAAVAQSVKAPAAKQLECPSSDFRKFSDAFADSVLVQRRFTRFPLEYRFLDTSTMDAVEKTRMIASFDKPPFKFGFFSSWSYRKAMGFETKIDDSTANPGEAELILFKPDTDEVVAYRFRKDHACWALYLIDNKTM